MDKTADYSDDNKQDKESKNKRKLAHPSVLPANFTSYEISQNFRAELNSSELGSDRFRKAAEMHMNELVDWNDPIASQLEELLLSNLRAVFCGAIRQIVKFGYSEDVAEKAVSRKGLYIGEGDPVTSIVHDTMNVLEGKDVATRDIVFETFQHFLHYTMVEIISVLREVRPSLTVGEAMWFLLICDLNIAQACAAEDCSSGAVCNGESSASSSKSQSKSEVQSTDTILSSCSAPTFQKGSSPSRQNYMSEAPNFGSFLNSPNKQSPLASEGVNLEAEDASSPYTAEKSSGTSGECPQECKSGLSSRRHNRKEISALRQKFLRMEKAYRACGKGGFKSGKIANVSGFVVERRLKPPSEIPNQHMKCGSSTTIGTTGVPSADVTCHVSINAAPALPAEDCSGTLHAKDAISTSSIVDTNTSTLDAKFRPKSELSSSGNQKVLDYCAGIPYDESLGKYVPQDQKDELILKLVSQVQELQDKLQIWSKWTNQKVMQVAHKLGKEQAELKTLRKEKQEAELFKKEKKILDEKTMKRISEMENAVENTRSQMESTTASALMLEAENSFLKKELGAAKLWAVKSMASHQQALEREQIVLKKAKSLESEKGLLQVELEREKDKLSNMRLEVDKEKSLQAKVEGRLEQERVAKEKLVVQAASIRKEREQLEACANAEESMIRKKAASDMQKHVEDIAKREKELAELNLKSESEKIAALRRGIDERNDSFSRNSKATPTVKGNKKSDTFQMMVSCQHKLAARSLREQECVMCLSEEMSVVFLPCAHQVVCAKCNELHEKQGMKDCPSCRTPIQRRIHAQFAGQ